jgi:hypothetical protein
MYTLLDIHTKIIKTVGALVPPATTKNRAGTVAITLQFICLSRSIYSKYLNFNHTRLEEFLSLFVNEGYKEWKIYLCSSLVAFFTHYTTSTDIHQFAPLYKFEANLLPICLFFHNLRCFFRKFLANE